MAQTVRLLAPTTLSATQFNGQYTGTVYTPDIYGIISNVSANDVDSLYKQGCIQIPQAGAFGQVTVNGVTPVLVSVTPYPLSPTDVISFSNATKSGAGVGFAYVTTFTPNVSFSVASSVNTDSSIYNWIIKSAGQ